MTEIIDNQEKILRENAESSKPKEVKIWEQYELCRDYIRNKMKSVYNLCENTRTIEQSNELYYYFLAKYKKEAFKLIETSIVKPHVIYRINTYFSI